MRWTTVSLCLLPTLALASSPEDDANTVATTTATTASTTFDRASFERAGWMPVATYPYLSSPTDDSSLHDDLKREIVNAAPAAPVFSQVSPITVLTEYQTINGVVQAIQVAYTQTFAPVPDQWPQPSAGSIGLGTIRGTVGVTKNQHRSVPEATAVAQPVPRSDEEIDAEALSKRESNGAAKGNTNMLGSNAGASSVLALAIAVAAMIVF